MSLNLTRRSVKGSPLTAADHDTNLDKIETGVLARPTTAAQTSAITAAVDAHVAAADPHPQYLTATEGNAAYATAAQGTLASTAIQPGNAALSDSREWSAATIEQAEAETGTATTRRAFTAQRVFQAIAAWWAASSAASKLAGIESGAQVNVATDITYDAASREVRSSTGTDATLPLVSTSSDGLAPATGTPSGKYLKDDGTWANVPAGSPSGTGTEIQYRNGTAFGAIPNSSVDTVTGAVTLARLIAAANGAASAPGVTLTGTWFTGGTATTTKPHVLIEPIGTTSTAWSTSGTGFGVNAPSGFTGNLLDLQVNGTSRFKVEASNTRVLANGYYLDTTIGYYLQDGVNGILNGSGFKGILTSSLSWVNSANANSGTIDLALFRDAANTLAQRNGTSAQTFRVYNTYTSGTNYELGKLEWSSNVFRIGTEKGSGGGTARTVEVHTDSIARLALDTTGSIRVVTGLTVATLPGTPAVGMVARVTDATAPAVGSTVTGGGAAAALVWYNGANWTVLGV